MTPDELETLLRAWGRAYGESRPDEWAEDESPTGDSPTARGLAFAPGSRTEAVRQLASQKRAGYGRLALMAASSGVQGMAMVPTWACEPVRARGLVRTSGGVGPSSDAWFTPQVEAVQTAWLVLHRFDRLRAVCLQVEYQLRGMRHSDKAELVAKRTVQRVGVKRYRDELRAARVWMHGRLAA